MGQATAVIVNFSVLYVHLITWYVSRNLSKHHRSSQMS